jgi:hypothetical protein
MKHFGGQGHRSDVSLGDVSKEGKKLVVMRGWGKIRRELGRAMKTDGPRASVRSKEADVCLRSFQVREQ